MCLACCLTIPHESSGSIGEKYLETQGAAFQDTQVVSDRAVLEFSSLGLQNHALPSELGGNGCRPFSLPQNDPGRLCLYSIFLLLRIPQINDPDQI